LVKDKRGKDTPWQLLREAKMKVQKKVNLKNKSDASKITYQKNKNKLANLIKEN
jgi:hypothetical protein